MKNKVLTIVALLIAISTIVYSKPINFTYPTNGAKIYIPANQTQITITIQYDYSGILGTNEVHTLSPSPFNQQVSQTYPYNLSCTFTLSAGSYTWKIERGINEFGLGYVKWGDDEITFDVVPHVTVSNSFGAGNVEVNYVNRSSGYTFNPDPNTNFQVRAFDQQYDQYDRKFQYWSYGSSTTSYEMTETANLNGNKNYDAFFLRQCVATFQKPDGNTSQNVIEGSTGSATAQTYYVSSDWISYSFINWTWSGGSSSNPGLTTPALYSHATFTANYTGTANASPMGIQFTSSNGNPISLSWNEHPNSNVTQYQVWRSVTGGSTGAIATLSRGTTSYTDYDYIQNPNGDAKLFYTVKAYYSPSGTWNDPGYIQNRGDMGAKIATTDAAEKLDLVNKEVPSEYSVSNYPNPFNPTTVINYQLPKDGFVTLKVYDILGKEVATLVNENKQAGFYNATFNASNLPSGIYIYSIKADGFSQSKKMLLIK